MAFTMVDFALYIIGIFASLIGGLYIYMSRKYSHWEKKGVPYLKPIPFFGNFQDCILQRVSPGDYFKQLYDNCLRQKFQCFYMFDEPAILLKDPELVKHALIKDFDSFTERYVSANENDIMSSMTLFVSKSILWRVLRTKLSPIFTSGKLKHMFSLMTEVGEDLNTHLESIIPEDGQTVIEVKGISSNFTMDVIGTCVFGLRVNSLNNPEAGFKKYVNKAFEFNYFRSFELSALFFWPRLAETLGLHFFSKPASDFLRKAMWDAIETRTKAGIRRNDLIDILIEMRKSTLSLGTVENPVPLEFDGDIMVAQAAGFFVAGFETSASLMAFTMYEIALQPQIQTRLREEIFSALKESDGQITYEMVMRLPYLDMVASETLRKYPVLPFLDRKAQRDYKLPDTDLVIEKGTPLFISISGLHYDPEYYPDPMKYDPERFNEKNTENRPSCVYLPFGDGPRICIGQRFGLLQAKLGIVKMLAKFELTPSEKTQMDLRLDPKALTLIPENGIHLNIRKIAPEQD